jgi:hypothetical protein
MYCGGMTRWVFRHCHWENSCLDTYVDSTSEGLADVQGGLGYCIDPPNWVSNHQLGVQFFPEKFVNTCKELIKLYHLLEEKHGEQKLLWSHLFSIGLEVIGPGARHFCNCCKFF